MESFLQVEPVLRPDIGAEAADCAGKGGLAREAQRSGVGIGLVRGVHRTFGGGASSGGSGSAAQPRPGRALYSPETGFWHEGLVQVVAERGLVGSRLHKPGRPQLPHGEEIRLRQKPNRLEPRGSGGIGLHEIRGLWSPRGSRRFGRRCDRSPHHEGICALRNQCRDV